MKWAEFKNQTVGEITDTVQFWESNSPEASEDAKEFAVDVLDNVILRFKDGSVAETLTDTAITMAAGQYWTQVAVRLAAVLGAGLNAKPLAGLPF